MTALQSPEPIVLLEEKEIGAILRAIRATDRPRTKGEPATKTLFFDFFGTANAGKTAITSQVERALRRSKMNVFCPPETAEWTHIRSKSTDRPTVFQLRHLNGVIDQVATLSQHRDFHAAIMSRGLIDMLYWYEKGVRDGLYTPIHQASVNEMIFECLRQDLVDAFVFFTCSPEIALKREYGNSVSTERGSNMNERVLIEAHEIYKVVLEEVGMQVPGLPIFHIDTSDIGIKESAQKLLSMVLPTACVRFGVADGKFLPRLPTLIRKRTASKDIFEEQLKLRGHPSRHLIEANGWRFTRPTEEFDTYLNPETDQENIDGFFGEIIRIRKVDGGFKFMYKGPARDRLLSHRRPLTVALDEADAQEILKSCPVITRTRKTRLNFRTEREPSKKEGHFFTLHIDTVEGLGDFTEIRARGSSQGTHTQELLALASELGFSPNDIVEGSYLALSLQEQ